jgi:predicted alpha/beta superfamily hydrolase
MRNAAMIGRRAFAAAILLTAPATAQEAPAGATPADKRPGYTMPQTEMWDMTSDNGEIYRIFLSYPSVGEVPKDGYPVLYVLDGNAMFAGFAEARRIQEYSDVGKAIVVGIGYPTDKAYDTRRLKDFTVRLDKPAGEGQRRLVALGTGQRDEFLAFLTGKLRAEIASRYKVNPARQSLFGHSLGGLFALHALYSRPDAFHAIVAASPSLWWNEQAMLVQERDFAARLAAGKIARVPRLLIVAGDREESIANTWDSEALAKRLAPLSAHGLRTRSEIYVGEGHMTVPARAMTDTLRFVATWP